MAYELRDGQGSLFRNRKKEKPNHPDMTGKLMLNGTLYYIAAWTKGGQGGKDKFLSLAVSEPRDERRGADDGDEIPF